MAARPFQPTGGGLLGYDPNFEPQTRARSNTWPCPRPEIIKEEEEEALIDGPINTGAALTQSHLNHHMQGVGVTGPGPGSGPTTTGGPQHQPGAGQLPSSLDQQQQTLQEYTSTTSPGQVGVGALGVKKPTSSRRNAWGNMSYADLITQAISSSPDKRLTLSQIYDWMVGNVPYFKDKGDSNSSAGWKVIVFFLHFASSIYTSWK